MLDFQKDILLLHVFLAVSMPESPVSARLVTISMRDDAAVVHFVTNLRNFGSRLQGVESPNNCANDGIEAFLTLPAQLVFSIALRSIAVWLKFHPIFC